MPFTIFPMLSNWEIFMNYWLVKSEPDAFSIQDLERVQCEPWNGVRNYQARNFMRDQMQSGDLVLFYHSNSKPSGVAGLCRVAGSSYPDPTQFDPQSPYFDPKANLERPRWFLVDMEFVEIFPRFIPLSDLKEFSELHKMPLLQKGTRLSVLPVQKEEFVFICKLGDSVNLE
jgi:predicted RNA-binding protein with PUA-like domain